MSKQNQNRRQQKREECVNVLLVSVT